MRNRNSKIDNWRHFATNFFMGVIKAFEIRNTVIIDHLKIEEKKKKQRRRRMSYSYAICEITSDF